MKKDLNYFMNLNYPLEIKKLTEAEGGGYHVSIPLLGKYAFQTDGDTIEEALSKLDSVKEEWFEEYLKRGTQIPEPVNEENSYSGKFLMRVPKELHRLLALKAKENEVSLNQYVQFLISTTFIADTLDKKLDTVCDKFQSIIDDYREVHYEIKRSNEPTEFSQVQIYQFNKAV